MRRRVTEGLSDGAESALARWGKGASDTPIRVQPAGSALATFRTSAPSLISPTTSADAITMVKAVRGELVLRAMSASAYPHSEAPL